MLNGRTLESHPGPWMTVTGTPFSGLSNNEEFKNITGWPGRWGFLVRAQCAHGWTGWLHIRDIRRFRNKNCHHLGDTYCLLSSLLWSLLIFVHTLYYYEPHFVGEETIQREENVFPNSQASKCEIYSQMGCWISILSLKIFFGYFEKQKKAKNNITTIVISTP